MIGPGTDRRSLCFGLGWSWCPCRGDSMSRAVGGGRRRCQEVWTSMSTMRPPSSVDGPTHNVNAESRHRQRRFLLGYTAPGEEASHRRRRRRCSSWFGPFGGLRCASYHKKREIGIHSKIKYELISTLHSAPWDPDPRTLPTLRRRPPP